MTAIFFIHALDSDRLFWALWKNMDDLERDFAPAAYEITRKSKFKTLLRLSIDYPCARQIFVQSLWAKSVYRKVRRAELPQEIQKQIRDALIAQKKKRLYKYEALGFSTKDFQSPGLLKQRYRELLRKHHPDYGGSSAEFMALQKAYKELLMLLRHQGV